MPQPDIMNGDYLNAHLAAYPIANSHLQRQLQICSVHSSDDAMSGKVVRSDFDSHANMIVLGKECYIISRSGRYAEVNAFSQEVGRIENVPIIDAAVAYDCPFTNVTYILIARNVLYVPSMAHNLIPPFILREAGIEVNDTAKIHVTDPTTEAHSVFFPTAKLRIPLSLHGIFSYFPTRNPTIQDLQESEKIVITPEGPTWNPHSEHFSSNEDSYLDWKGEMVQRHHRETTLIEEEDIVVQADSIIAKSQKFHSLCSEVNASSPSDFGDEESRRISDFADEAITHGENIELPPWCGIPVDEDHVRMFLSSVNVTLDPATFAQAISDRASRSKFAMSIGSVSAGGPKNNDLFIDDPTIIEIDIEAVNARKPKGVTPVDLAKVWRIDVETARRTIEVTTQWKQQDADGSLSRNFSTNDRMLRYRRINSHFFTDTFFVTKKAKSTRGNTCMQLFVSDKGFVYVVPMKSKGEFPKALKMFAKEIGVPLALILDPSGEQSSNKVKQFCHEIGTTLRHLEESTQWANLAELYIGLTKESIRKDMQESDSPIVLWDYCAERRARINNLTARNLFQLEGQNPHLATFGEEGDISNICDFKWFEWCYFRQQKAGFPLPSRELGRVLGPSKNAGNEMAQWVLQANGQIVPRRSLRNLKTEETNNNVTEERKREVFMNCIRAKLGDSMSLPSEPLNDEVDDDYDFVPYEDDEEVPRTIPENEAVDARGKPILQQSVTDMLIHAEVLLPRGEELLAAKVIRRSMDDDGKVIGDYNAMPIFNTMLYDVEFPDGTIKPYAANVIADNIYDQVDSEGSNIVKSIDDYRTDANAVSKEDQFVVDKNGRKHLRKTTAGWKLCVVLTNGASRWIPLKDLKESNPVDVAEFAVSRGIDDEPAFKWWVPYTLRKRDTIISTVKARLKVSTHKYGVEVPTSIEHGKRLDKENGNTLWADALTKEMTNVSIAFEVLEKDQAVPVGWSKSSGHLIWDVKMDFTRKCRWVKDGHRTPDPKVSNYAGVVSRDSVRIALTYAALNDFDVTAADIQNAYLQAPSSEKHYIVCGAEFGLEHVGKVALIRRALYGGKLAGKDFWTHLRSCMKFLGFTSCQADPDIWMREAVKPDGSQYWEYVLLYVDDCLVISDNGEKILRNEIGKYFKLKEASIGPPDIYRGGKMRKVELENGAKAWSFSSSQYVQEAVRNVEVYLNERKKKLASKAGSPISNNYRPEIDETDELNLADAAYYQSLIGILRWTVELGRVDICCEVSMLSSCLALPREGHLEQLFHIFAYLKKKHNTEMVFDPSYPDIDGSKFERQDWSDTVYGDNLKEDLPPNMPEARGFGFITSVYVDADHAGDTITRRSRTGFLVYCNSALVHWMSKKQNSIETSSFGSEFCAMKMATEYVRGLRFKLRMMGISCDDPTFVYADNQSVLANTTMPQSMLKKKSNSIAYHFVREGCAKDEWRTTYVNTHDNPSDILTKPLPSGEKRSKFCRKLLHHL